VSPMADPADHGRGSMFAADVVGPAPTSAPLVADSARPPSLGEPFVIEGEGLPPLTGGCRHPGGLPLTERAVELAGLARGARVLDLGCGDGVTAEHLERRFGLRATGIDVSAALICQGRERRPDLDLREGAAECLPLPDGGFEAVLAECVLSIVADPGAVVDECARVLRPGGLLLVNDLYRRADPDAARLLLLQRGFDVVVWEDHSTVLARLVWDLAGSRGSPPKPRRASGVDGLAAEASATDSAGLLDVEKSAGPAGLLAGRGGGLGYFLCVARRGRRTPQRGADAR